MKKSDLSKRATIPTLTEKQDGDTFPKFIGPYPIESLLRKGGMSILYLASDPLTHKTIVIKTLSPNHIRNKNHLERFLQEAKIISLFHHPNIVQLIDQGMWEKGVFIAMEFVQGVSLRQFIQQHSLNEKKTLEIILQVAYALCHLHSHGIIHRDIKPENILLDEAGNVKVIDFGIALLQEEKGSLKEKMLMGTPVYMSPEQKSRKEKIDYTTDIYSLGVVAYELLTGRLSEGIIDLQFVEKDLKKILSKALKENPKERYQDIVELITDISQYLQSYPKAEKTGSVEIFGEIERINKALVPLFQEKRKEFSFGCYFDKENPLGVYADFFSLGNNEHLFFVAETVEENIPSFAKALFLKGAITSYLKQNRQKNLDLSLFLSEINKTLLEEKQIFSYVCIAFHLGKEEMVFSLGGERDIYLISETLQKVIPLTSHTSLLGEKDATFTTTLANFSFSDKLVIPSLNFFLKKEELIQDLLKENLSLPVKTLAKKIGQEFSSSVTKTPKTRKFLYCIARNY